jgi:cytoskeletal protein CcmA (bactofilin family)
VLTGQLLPDASNVLANEKFQRVQLRRSVHCVEPTLICRIITNKGDLNSNRAICDYAEIQGTMRGNLICSGEVHIRLKGKLSGSIEAKSVHIDKKCEADFVRPIRAELVDIEGIISARIISTGKVVIQKTGRLTGAVFGRGFTVEKGGEFFGELSIGKVEMTQGELLDTHEENRVGVSA